MSSYKLNINLTRDDVLHILHKLKQKICIIKSVNGEMGNVVWQSLSPFEENSLSWEEEYSVYATLASEEGGAEIFKASSFEAEAGSEYVLKDDVFSDNGDGTPDTYTVRNENNSDDQLFGLFQGVSVNGNDEEFNPLNAVRVGNNQKTTFTPIEKVSVFLHDSQDNGVILTEIYSDACEVDLTKETEQTLVFDRSNNTFGIE